jgi:hypothetical protein
MKGPLNGMSSIGDFGRFFESAGKAPETKNYSKKIKIIYKKSQMIQK